MMSSLAAALLIVAGLCAPATTTALAGGYERIRIQTEETRLDAVLYRPQGPGPFPAVVALHGCGGLWRQDGSLSERHRDWGERLRAAGFVVLLPDSFGSRGLGSQCGVKELTVRASRERVADAAVARTWLQQRVEVDGKAIALLGWSSGGSTVLAASRTDRRPADKRADFSRAIAFYPSCRFQAESAAFDVRLPLLILMGDADDWTPPVTCEALARMARGRGGSVDLVIYPGALHDFDHPRLEVREKDGIAFSATGTGKATVGTNPQARDEAIRRVGEFLRGR